MLKMWKRKMYSYEEAWAKAAKRNERILAKAKVGQEIVQTKGYKYDKYGYEVAVYKLGAIHPELAEKLGNEESFEFEGDTLIYAGDGVCYYTGKDWGRRQCNPHYNGASAWMAL